MGKVRANMQEIPGKRADSCRYVYQGYEYHIDTTSPHIYRCSTRTTTGCRGAAEVDAQLNEVDVFQPHEGHEPNMTIVEESLMRSEMLRLAKDTNNPLKEIFDAVSRRNPIVARKLLYPKIRRAMQYARTSVKPPIPESLLELARVLETYAPTERVYRDLVEADDGSIALILASDGLLDALGTSREIYVDGTFKVAPSHPPIAQLYTVHIRVMDTGIAAVYVLCSARTSALYSAIFRRIVGLAPGVAENLRFIMGDYERSAMRALREVFPEAHLHGCWFHFTQALVRRWRRLGLSDAPTSVLAMSMALPLAPSNSFNEGLGLLAGIADQIAADYPAVLQFMLYLRRQWSPLADVVSVHGCPSRTNNLVESFHNEAKRKLGGLHPNIWKFIEHLTQLIENQEIDLARLLGGERARRPRSIRNMARDTLIRDTQHALSVGRFTLMQFLERCARRTAAADRLNIERHNGEENGEQGEDLVEHGLMAAGEPGLDEPVPRGHGQGRGVQARNRGGVNLRGRGDVEVEPAVADPAAMPPGENVQDRGRGRGRGRRRGRGRGRGARLGVRGAGNQNPEQNRPPGDELLIVPIEQPQPEVIVERQANDDLHLRDDNVEQVPMPENDVPVDRAEQLPDEEWVNDDVVNPAGFCCVCLTEPATHAFVPCGHFCCCANCAGRILVRCPVCRDEYLGVYRIRANP